MEKEALKHTPSGMSPNGKYYKKDLWHNSLPYTLFFISIKLISILKLRCLKK